MALWQRPEPFGKAAAQEPGAPEHSRAARSRKRRPRPSSGRKIAATAEAVPVIGDLEQSITIDPAAIDHAVGRAKMVIPAPLRAPRAPRTGSWRSRRPGRERHLVPLRLERGDPPRAAAAEVRETRRTGRNGSSQGPGTEVRRILSLYEYEFTGSGIA
jgi:hypothetical protein